MLAGNGNDPRTKGLVPCKDLFTADGIARLYRGGGSTSRILSRFRCRQSLWHHCPEQGFLPVGFLAAQIWGALSQYESGKLSMVDRNEITWERAGGRDTMWNVTQLPRAPSRVLRYSRCLLFLHFGGARLERGGELVCTLHVPLIGPSRVQALECYGYFSFPSGKRIRYVLNPSRSSRDTPLGCAAMNSLLERAGHLIPPEEGAMPMFPDAQIPEELQALTDDDRAFVVSVALWSRIFSPYV